MSRKVVELPFDISE